MPDAHANFAYTLVVTPPAPALSGLSLTVASGSVFPATPFNAVVCPVGVLPLAANAEVVRVTGRASNTLTILRAQEGSAARSILVGDSIFAAITAKTLTDAEGIPNPITTTVNITPADAADSSALVLTGSSSPLITPNVPSPTGWTGPEHIMRVNTSDGSLAMDIDSSGILDSIHVVVQDPPDTGSNGTTNIRPGSLAMFASGAGATVFSAENHPSVLGGSAVYTAKAAGGGALFEISAGETTDTQLLLVQQTAQTADLIQAWDRPFNFRVFRVLADGGIVTRQHAAPASGDLDTGDCAMWFDDSPGATKVMFKAKDSAGTVKTGSVTLT